MASPRLLRRSEPDSSSALAWNAMIDLCATEPLENCTPIQRQAALLFWYQSEVNNGGHFQYFMNRPEFPHREVLALMQALGAPHSAYVFDAVLKHVEARLPQPAEDVQSYLAQEEDLDLSAFDMEWGSKGDEEVQACLRFLLQANENEFVRWTAQ
jgi:hypothetical protein